MEGLDLKGLSDLDFMSYFGENGYDYDSLPPEGQARFSQFMEGDKQVKGKQYGAKTPPDYSFAKPAPPVRRTSLPGLMSMATQGIQRVPNGKRKGLMEF